MLLKGDLKFPPYSKHTLSITLQQKWPVSHPKKPRPQCTKAHNPPPFSILINCPWALGGFFVLGARPNALKDGLLPALL